MNDAAKDIRHINTTRTRILALLLAAEGGVVSGSTMAETLGISRVAIWQHMNHLREEGFAFEATRSQGYKLCQQPATLHPDLIAALLHGRDLRYSLSLHAEVDSTNDEVARRLAAGADDPLIVIASRQSRGRGRFGRVWHSDDSTNLHVSFGFRPALPHSRMQTFTLWMGVTVCDLIAAHARTTPGLKWPNDILFDGRKAGGMLTEARGDSDQIRDLVFGLGLNLNGDSRSWPDGLEARATSLAEQTGAALDANRFTAALIGRVVDAYGQFVRGEHLDRLADLWQRFDVLRGKRISVLQGRDRITGTASGIDDTGALLLRNDTAGRTERFLAGEVTLEKQAFA
ncbi:biotin--[acetyl-CoA-carboxylase] ligase [Nibricoccus sp. IMCC34717]|uniref:biotin--[acetyl-CoA-carboxylase] ligase n=1 Tax=Nibricoccus sp. IMCC34717 TaxID=3034021 RepID=UPI00384F2E04